MKKTNLSIESNKDSPAGSEMSEEDSSRLPTRKRWRMVLLIVLGGCAATWIVRGIYFQVRYGGMPIAAQTGWFPPDCAWGGLAKAWIDEDEDGVWDEAEPPLLGVMFHVDDTLNDYKDVGWGPSESNWKGESSVTVWLPGCPRARFEVYPDIPPGYRLTTAPRLSATVREYGRAFEFGFTYLPGVPTATPRPSEPICSSYSEMTQPPPDTPNAREADVSDLAAAPDGSIWAATFGNGAALWNPATRSWSSYRVEDGLVSNEVRSITITDDSVVWFATEGGASRFYNGKWEAFTSDEGLIDNNVYAIAIAEDATVWFATDDGVSALDQSTDTWTGYTQEDGLADNFNQYVGITPDGSIWFGTVTRGVARLTPPENPEDEPTWRIYSEHHPYEGDHYIPVDFLNSIEVSPDGTAWFGGFGELTQLNLESENWTAYDYTTTVNDLAVAPDGSIWIASGSRSPVAYHFIPASDKNGEDVWRIYDERDGIPNYEDGIESVIIAGDGAVWFNTRGAVTQCIFPEGRGDKY